MPRFYGRFSLLASLVVLPLSSLFGCTFDPHGGSAGPGTIPGIDGGSSDRGGVNADLNSGGETCPSMAFQANNLPPDLLIVLDRSGSMNEDSMGNTCQGGCGVNSKWSQMTTAINQVVAQSQSTVNWGLKFFGTGTTNQGNQACAVANGAAVAPATNTATAIATAIAAPGNQPVTSTPTRAAVQSAGNYLAGLTDLNPKYILLATDGQPNCAQGGNNNTPDDMAAIQAVGTVAGMGFPVFVIGIAADNVAGQTLDSMAMAGGRPRQGTPLYYSVSTTADLAAALAAIQGMTALPCQFQLPGVPSDLGAVTVTVGGSVVPMSSWMYGLGNRSIVFPDASATCTALKNGTVQNVIINLPCGVTIIP